MNSNNDVTQGYPNLPMHQTENSFAPLQILNNNEQNIQHSSINNATMSNTIINTAIPAPQNATFEFYFPFGSRIYHITYQCTELHPLENARLLNNNINLSHIPNYQFPHHYNIQSLIQQQIQQQVQQPQQNPIQQSFNTSMSPQSNSQNNNAYNTSANGAISDDMQYLGFQNSS
ncbi:hypothetical protein C1645_824252 [Glomus cerebriforme]|uniref:Uncharacterized protein n=1 Tax=Glomus cerebriforme TaxID=658196 RepID=A0A397SV06_9GLOM|nr:hypothetical protein C1645_824252 [Glomus cerebriforme]